MTDPIDNTHEESMQVIEAIRHHVNRLRARVSTWDLPPYPPTNVYVIRDESAEEALP